MSTASVTLTLMLYCIVMHCVFASHFRGAVIMVRPKPGGRQYEMEISFHISWAGSDCSTNGKLISTSQSLKCQSGCFSGITDMSYICTDYSSIDSWSFGARNATYDFSAYSGSSLTIGYDGNAWINPFARWNIPTTFSLKPRCDTGQINSSPRALSVPVLRLQSGCYHTIPLAVSDPDGDTVHCRWAVGNECSSVCNNIAFPGAVLNSATCTLTYQANKGTGNKVAAIMIEDYIPGSSQPLSSVAIQFVVFVVSSSQSCSQKPKFITPTPLAGSCVLVFSGEIFTTQLIADSESSSVSIVEIVTASPIGTKKSTVQHVANTNSYYVNITWIPSVDQNSMEHHFCFMAINSEGIASNQSCIKLCTKYPQPIPFAEKHLVYLHNVTLPIRFSTALCYSQLQSFIITIYEHGSNIVVHRIDTSLSSEVTFDGQKKFTIKPNCKFTDGKTYYIILGRGVVFNNDSEVVTDKTLLIFEVIDPAPSIVSNPNDTTAASPFSGVFTCSARGYGVPVFIEWRRNNSDLPSSSYSFTQILSSDIIASTLVIPNVTNEDVGNYYCVAWNKRKTAQSTHANLLFAGKPIQPWVVVHNAQIRLTINTYNLSMKCLPISSSLFYNWEKQNSNLPSRVHDVSSSTLIITNLRPEDSGEYRCTVGNYTGNMTSDYVKVTIEASPPIITKQPTNTTVSFFGQAIFECKVQAVGKITIIWKRDQSILPVTATVNNIISANEITSILTITGVAGYYKGYYYCTAENEAGQTNSRFAELSVQVPDPEILRPLENITVLFKKMATLNCLASSYGTLMYDWKRLDGNQVSLFASQAYVPNQYLKANFIVVTYQLTIPNVQLSDEGWHCCVATNEGGESEKCVWLEVDTAPVITKAPIDITVKEYSYDINPLNCSASGMGPINYQWEKYQPSDDSWIIPSYKTVNSTTPKLIFSVITEEDGGVYHCIATNDDGSVVSDNATITVYGPPIITSVSSDTTSVEGSKVNLMCNATNDVDALDEVKIVWIHKTSSQSEQELEMNGKISFYNKTDSSTGKIHSVLLFDSVYHTDDGEYICRAFNHPQSYSEVNVSLIVQFPPILILFPSQSPLNVNVNQPVQLHCIGTGLPIPKIQWSKDGIVVTTAEPTQNFVTVDASNPSTAVYTCVGTNTINGMVHKQSSSITVIVAESCPMLANPANGRVIVVGTSAFYVCNTGYTVVGNPFNTCLNGKWVSPPALCN